MTVAGGFGAAPARPYDAEAFNDRHTFLVLLAAADAAARTERRRAAGA